MKLNLQLSCYNGARYLPFLFDALRRQTRQGWHLYVLDNASTPEEAGDIRRVVDAAGFPITLFRVEKNIGFAGAHNLLFTKHEAESDYVQLLNDDAFLEPDFLEQLEQYLETHPLCASVSGKILRWHFDERAAPNGGRTSVVDSLGLEMDRKGFFRDRGSGEDAARRTIPSEPYRVLGVSGCLPMYRVSAVHRVSFDGGLFDKLFVIYKEDVDLALRLRAAGYQSVIVPAAVAYHRRTLRFSSASMASVLRPANENTYYSYRNHLWTLFAHMSWASLFCWRAGIIPVELAKLFYWMVRQPSFVMQMIQDTYAQRTCLREKRSFVRRLRAARRHASPVEKRRPHVQIAVVTVGHNDLNETCLASLAEARRRTSLTTAVVIVDNHSVNVRANELVGTFFHDAWCLLREGDFGFGRSSNRGAEHVDADYYFFLNPDTNLVEPDLFDKLYQYLETHPDAGIVAPKVLYFDGRLQETCRRFPKWYMPFVQRTSLQHTAFGKRYAAEFAMRDYDHASARDVDWVQGSALCIRGDLWKRLGGFDHRYFMYFEDMDLCRRVHMAGKQVVYDPTMVIQHAYGKESAKISGLIKNLLLNDMARAHLISWAKYFWKWKFDPLPKTNTPLSPPHPMTNSASLPKVGIIYLTYNTKDSATEIPRCLRSLQSVDYPFDRLEIICVENPSPHGASWPLIERDFLPLVGTRLPPITIHKNEKDVGYSGANNVGLQIAMDHGCDYVYLLNQDCEADPAFLRRAVERAENDGSIGFVQSLLMLGDEKDLVNSIGNRYHFLGYGYTGGYRWTRAHVERFFQEERLRNPSLVIPTFSGAAVLVRVAMAKKIGLFDAPFYMYHEDIDAAFNGRIHGWKTVIEPTSIVYHYYQFSKSIKKFYWMERNRLLFLLSYYKPATWVLIAIPFVCVEIASFVFALRGGWWREKARAWKFFLFPGTWSWIARRRRRLQSERQIGDRELLSMATSEILFQEGNGGDEAGIQRDVNSFLVTGIANPLLTGMWKIIYWLIRW